MMENVFLLNSKGVLVTGGHGNLALEFKKIYPSWHYLGKNQLDITSQRQIKKTFKKLRPRVVLHMAAYTNVQKAEKEKKKCFKVNVEGTKNIARACLKYNSVLIHASTYYIYTGKIPNKETEKITPQYPDYYSKTKYLAEKEISKILRKKSYYILRFGSLFGGKKDAKITTILINWDKPEFYAIERYIQPAYVKDAAKIVGKYFVNPVLKKTENLPNKSIYNIANEGHCTVYNYAKEVFKTLKKNVKVIKVKKIDEGVKRNDYAINLNRLKSLRAKPRKWQIALKEYLLSL